MDKTIKLATDVILELIGDTKIPFEIIGLKRHLNLPFIRSVHHLTSGLRVVTIHRKASDILYFGARFELLTVEVFDNDLGRIDAFRVKSDPRTDGKDPYDKDIKWENIDITKRAFDIKKEKLKIVKLHSIDD